jgi:dihydroorotase
MPNTTPVNDSVKSLQWMLDAARHPVVNLLAMPAATFGSHGMEITDMHQLVQAGAVGFTDDGKPILDDEVMYRALLAAATAGVPISQHAEDTTLTGGCSMNHGPVAFRLGLRGMPVEAESGIVERDIEIVRRIQKQRGLQAHLHVQHVSTARALEAIRRAKSDGLHVTCEAAPHHFTLTDEDVARSAQGVEYDTRAKMNPPLRAEADRLAVVQALLDGTIDCIATDHAPHASWEKQVEFERAPNGITGLETALGLALRVLHRENGMPLAQVLGLLSAQPAALLGLKDRGRLGAGAHADLVVFDPAEAWPFELGRSRSRSHNSPFDGAEMLGKVRATVCGGLIVYRA